MIELKSLTMQFLDGDPGGIRRCYTEGESLVTIVIPRDKLSAAKKLPGIPPRGIYYLLDEHHGIINRVYVGQTIQGISRLDTHKSQREFWNKAIMFLDENRNVSKDLLDGLESKALAYIHEHGSYEIENTIVPKPYIDPYSEERMGRLHEDILFRMKVLGYDLAQNIETASTRQLFHTKKRGVCAKGHYNKTNGTFTVLAGSEIDLTRLILHKGRVMELRNQLFAGQTGKVKLPHDITFSSPSSAALFVLGGSQNGWVEWVDENGRTLDKVYRKADS